MSAIGSGSGQRGAALIAVLWVALFLGLLSVSLVAVGRSGALLARNIAAITQARTLADAAIETGIAQLLGGTGSVPLNGQPLRLAIAGRNVELSIRNSLSLLDINQASEENLRAFLQGLQVPDSQLMPLVDAIADWRDADDLRRLNGAEYGDYVKAGRRNHPRNRRFDRVDELKHVVGMTPALFDRIAPYVTVHGGGVVDINMAPAEVMRSIPGVSENAIAERLQVNREAVPVFRGAAGRAYRFSARLLDQSGVDGERVAWIRLTGNPVKPYWVLEWGGL